MKRFIFQTIWAGLLTVASINALLHTPGQVNKIFTAIILALTAIYYARAIRKLGRWLKATPEEKEKLKKDWILERRSNFTFWLGIGFLAFLVIGLGQLFNWHPLYIFAAGLYFLFTIPNAIYKARERRNEKRAKDAEAEVYKMKLEEARKKELEREENAKKDPQLVGPAEAPPGKIAIGWLIDRDKDTKLRTAELKMIDRTDREAHFYIVGASGMGKTKLLEALILQDAKQGRGFGVIDPHGDLIEDIKIHLAYNPGPKDQRDAEQRAKFLMERIVLIDPTDKDQTACFNPLEPTPGVRPDELAGEMVMIFKKIWADSWGPRLEDIMRASFTALVETGGTICDLPSFLTDDDFRRKITSRVKDEIALMTLRHFEEESEGAKNNAIGPVLNKINALLADERLRDLFSSPKSTFNLRDVIDSGKILLVKLNKGRLKGSADLLGALIVSKIQIAAFGRTDIPREARPPFYLYIDEFQNFATEHFLETLAESRKYRLYLILAHQNLSQLPEPLQAAILTNCNVQMYFRTSHQDAVILSKQSGEKPDENFGYGGIGTPWKQYNLKGQRWGDRAQTLQDLPPRYFVFKNNREGALLVKTDRIADPLAADENIAQNSRELANFFVGGLYLRKRSELSRHGRGPEKSGDPEEPQTFREKRGS